MVQSPTLGTQDMDLAFGVGNSPPAYPRYNSSNMKLDCQPLLVSRLLPSKFNISSNKNIHKDLELEKTHRERPRLPSASSKGLHLDLKRIDQNQNMYTGRTIETSANMPMQPS